MQLAHNRSVRLRDRDRCLGPAARATLVCALLAGLSAVLLAPVVTAEEEPPICDEPVVPPGQNAVLAAMLGRGAVLPDACAFAGGQADGPVIRATYACPSGDVVFELVHPGNATAEAIQTERFALTLQSGSPSNELVDGLVGIIRSREMSFEWKLPDAPRAAEGAAENEN